MPRPVRRILSCVLIGLLLNTAVTVACWLAQPTRFYRAIPITIIGTPGPGEFVSSTTTVHYLMHSVQTRAAGRSLPGKDTEGWERATSTTNWQHIYKFGLPFRSLQRRNTQQWFRTHQTIAPVVTNTTNTLPLWQRGLPTGLGAFQYPRFPIQPVVPGMFYNTLIYAGIPALVMTAVHLRARSRRRHSRCPACGYPVAGLPTCPECGPLKQTSQPTQQ
jgi:hypothetical protein